MPAEFRYVRTIDLTGGFSADMDPNTSAPAERDIFRLQPRPPSGNILTTGNEMFFDFRASDNSPVLGVLVDWQAWFRDIKSGIWTNAEPVTKTSPFDAWKTDDIRDADIFVQILGMANLGAAATAVIRMTET